MSQEEQRKKFAIHFGNQLRAFREMKGVTLRELEMIEISEQRDFLDRAMISKIENAHQSPSIFTLRRILTALDSNLKEFFQFYKEKES